MPQPVYGNVDRQPAVVLASLIAALGADGVIDDETGRVGPVLTVTDSGNLNGGDGGGTQPLVTCQYRHGLNPGDMVTLTGTTGYDGTFQVEPAGDPARFLLDNIAYSGDSAGGSWK